MPIILLKSDHAGIKTIKLKNGEVVDIERRVTIADTEVDSIIEYLQLILDNSEIIDKEYPDEGSKVYGHIKGIIEQLEEGKKS